MAKEEVIPPAAIRDPQSLEMARIWIAEQGLHCSLNIGTYGDNEVHAWGIIIADMLRHIAGALSKRDGSDYDVALFELGKSLQMEMENPTSEISGNFL